MATQSNPTHLAPLGCSILEAASILGICRSGVYKLLGEGRLKAAKLGKRRVILLASINALVDSLTADQVTDHE